MMFSERNLITVKLNRQNYQLWRNQLEDILYGNNIGEFISKGYLNSAKLGEEEKKFDEAAYKRDQNRQRKAMYFVRASSPKPIQGRLKNTRTLKEMLDIIKNSMTKGEIVYNLSAELTNSKWGRLLNSI